MTDPLQEIVRRAVIGKLVADEGGRFTDRPGLLAAMQASGSRTVDAIGGDGTVYGTASRCNGKKTADVYDEAAFFAWVLERHPERIIRLIDPEWRKALLTMAGRLGDPVEAGTGEQIPGVRVTLGDTYVQVRATDEGRLRMRARLDPASLFALPVGDEADEEGEPR